MSVELGEHRGKRRHAIGQPGSSSLRAEEERGLGRAHRVLGQATHRRHVCDEERVQPVHLGLQRRAGGIVERLVRRVVVLALARGDRGVAQAVPGVLDRLVDVQRDHADRAHATGLGDEEPIGGAADGVGRGEGGVVGHGPDGLHGGRLAHAACELEAPAGLAAGRIDVEHDAGDHRVAKGCLQPRADLGVARQPRGRLQPQRALDQGAVDRQDGDRA
jgi:hypothetical protein